MRKDIVIVDLRPLNPSAKVRPALVVQNDRDNNRMSNTIIAQISSNISWAQEDTQLLIDESHSDWNQSGLRLPSTINASNLATVPNRNIIHVIGVISDETMEAFEECLRSALEL